MIQPASDEYIIGVKQPVIQIAVKIMVKILVKNELNIPIPDLHIHNQALI